METLNKTVVSSTGAITGAEKPHLANGTMNESEGEVTPEGLSSEYSEVNSNLRHYSNLRFAMYTVYFAVLGGLISVAFGFFETKSGSPEYAKLWARIGGFLVTSVFFVLELNCVRYLETYVSIGKALEVKLHYKQISTRHTRSYSGLLSPTYAALRIYGALLIFWFAMIIWMMFVIVREKSWWLDPFTVIVLSFVLVVVLAVRRLYFQWRSQRQASRWELCEIFDELTRTELEFRTAIVAAGARESSLDAVESIRQDLKIEDAAYNHYEKWNRLSYLVKKKRLSDPVKILVKQKLLQAYKEQFRGHFPDFEKDAHHFPHLKKLLKSCLKEEKRSEKVPNKSVDATARPG